MSNNELLRVCEDNNIELTKNGNNKIILTCSQEIDNSIKDKIKAIVSENTEITYQIAPKESTLDAIENMFKHLDINCKVNFDTKERHVIINVESKINLYLEDIANIRDRIDKDGYFETFEIYLNGNKVSLLAEEITRNNNSHEKIIKESDIKDFLITLNTAESFEDLLNKI